jgi:hypothetical protein
MVGDSDAIFTLIYLNQTLSYTCGELQDLGATGFLSNADCAFLPHHIGDLCDCPPRLTVCPALPDEGPGNYAPCSVCGEGKRVGNVYADTGDGRPCGSIELFGANGYIPLTMCGIVAGEIQATCECCDAATEACCARAPFTPGPSSSPSSFPTTPKPSSSPSLAPSSFPNQDPSSSPSLSQAIRP